MSFLAKSKDNYDKYMLKVFEVFDIDGNGYISIDELKRILHEYLNENLTDDDMKEIMSLIDTNGDGQLNYEEFIKCFKSKKFFLLFFK